MPEIPKSIEERRLEDIESILKATVRATYESGYGIIEFRRNNTSVPEVYTIELRDSSGDTKVKFFIGTSDGSIYSKVLYDKEKVDSNDEKAITVKGGALNEITPEDLIEDCL